MPFQYLTLQLRKKEYVVEMNMECIIPARLIAGGRDDAY
jgi:hypothetical protein